MRRMMAVGAVLGLLAVPALSQGLLGVGGSFWTGNPVLDAFVQVPLSDVTSLRMGVGTVFSAGGLNAFTIDGTFLVTIALETLTPYFGAGAGAFMVTGGGTAIGIFTVNGIAGVALPLADTFGIYGQIRFLGQVGGGGFTGDLLPGFGLCVVF